MMPITPLLAEARETYAVTPHETATYRETPIYEVSVRSPDPSDAQAVTRYTFAAEHPVDALENGIERFDHPFGVSLAEVSPFSPDNRETENDPVLRYLSGGQATREHAEDQAAVAEKPHIGPGTVLDIDWEYGDDAVLVQTEAGDTIPVARQPETVQVKDAAGAWDVDDVWQEVTAESELKQKQITSF
jgi:hypothetical protein